MENDRGKINGRNSIFTYELVENFLTLPQDKTLRLYELEEIPVDQPISII